MCARTECGGEAILQLDLMSGSTQMGGGTTATITMPPCAPEPIASVSSTSSDGRHRTFSFTVPSENGDPIYYYALRRYGPLDSQTPVQYLYNVSCSAASSMPMASDVAVSWQSLTCTPGQAMAFTVGLDVPPEAPAYITPTHSYNWSLIGARARNIAAA